MESDFSIDNRNEQLLLRGAEVSSEDGEVYDLLASEVANVMVSALPSSFRVQLCNTMLGSSRELYRRQPLAEFEHHPIHGLVAHLSTPFFAPSDGLPEDVLRSFFEDSLDSGECVLRSLESEGRLLLVEHIIDEEFAELNYSLVLSDQTFADAEQYLDQIDSNVSGAHTPPSLFICHASEDKPFAEKLVAELDRRAMHAWYDKREILVGDSIVERINQGLGAAGYLIAVLSPRSVVKPWVVREMSSSLMRQLGGGGIKILPVLFEPCEIPVLLTDIRYANFTDSFAEGIMELMDAIRGNAVT